MTGRISTDFLNDTTDNDDSSATATKNGVHGEHTPYYRSTFNIEGEYLIIYYDNRFHKNTWCLSLESNLNQFTKPLAQMKLDQNNDDIKNGINISIRNDDNNIDKKLYLLLFGVWNKLSIKLIKIDNCAFSRHRKIDYYESFVKLQQILKDNKEKYNLRNEKFAVDLIDNNTNESDEKENETRRSLTYNDNHYWYSNTDTETAFGSSHETYQYQTLSDYIQISDTETSNSDIYNDKMKLIDMFDAFHHGIIGIKKKNAGDQNGGFFSRNRCRLA